MRLENIVDLLVLSLLTAPACKLVTARDWDHDGDEYSAEFDCDDYDAATNPGGAEIHFDGLDNDCDSSTLDDEPDIVVTGSAFSSTAYDVRPLGDNLGSGAVAFAIASPTWKGDNNDTYGAVSVIWSATADFQLDSPNDGNGGLVTRYEGAERNADFGFSVGVSSIASEGGTLLVGTGVYDNSSSAGVYLIADPVEDRPTVGRLKPMSVADRAYLISNSDIDNFGAYVAGDETDGLWVGSEDGVWLIDGVSQIGDDLDLASQALPLGVSSTLLPGPNDSDTGANRVYAVATGAVGGSVVAAIGLPRDGSAAGRTYVVEKDQLSGPEDLGSEPFLEGNGGDHSGWSVTLGHLGTSTDDDTLDAIVGTLGTVEAHAWIVFDVLGQFSEDVQAVQLALVGHPIELEFTAHADAGTYGASSNIALAHGGDGAIGLLLSVSGVAAPGAEGPGVAYLIQPELLEDLRTESELSPISLSGDEAATEGTIFLGGDEDDFFGAGLAGPGDLNGDGIGDLILGAPGYVPPAGTAGEAWGAAFIYLGGTAN